MKTPQHFGIDDPVEIDHEVGRIQGQVKTYRNRPDGQLLNVDIGDGEIITVHADRCTIRPED